MAFTFDSTSGGAATNSYVSVAEMDDYMDSFVFSEEYDALSTTQKQKLAVMAFRVLETQRIYGRKTDTSQAAQFPRYQLVDWEGQVLSQTTIPQQLKDAQSELAFFLLEENSRHFHQNTDSDDVSSYSVDGFSLSINNKKKSQRDNLPQRVQELLKDIGPRVWKHSKRNRRLSN